MLHAVHFTREQAADALPLVGRLIRQVREARDRLTAAGLDADLALRAEATGGAWPGRRRAAATLAVSLGIERLEELGVLVRDLDRGIVDFPSVREGREVYLCWHLGEPAITHWHELESGFAGRRPLERETPRTS